ncbi:hypothetical protein [Clostridium sp. AM58-1XD]|uniref:hypothetical protein n=1 Tax=Clostridium sp. AM58-1XD TaxID=2292307 RepID=UPI000E548AAF|nr:hypothetical protein [Clostridium sp. AM58-1XD]RGZ00101.1 hypothetical protein DXA13_05610 [Clostridium sp. AM58-1XD]
MKKWMIAVIAVLMITACGQKNKETAVTETETTVETTKAAAETETKEPEMTSVSTEESESESADADEKNEKKITGTVIDAAMNSIIIKTDDGEELAFSKEDAKVELKDGLLIGIEVTLTYTGEIKDGNAADVKVIKITDAQQTK